jgi:LPXTG-motif cell wall-anchored protein
MRTIGRMRSIPLLLTLVFVFVMTAPAMSMAAQAPVNLLTTSPFVILAGTTITNTGPTVISGNAGGDIGLYPGSAFTGRAQVTLTGAVHLHDTVARLAKADLVTAYIDAAGRTPVTTIPTDLGGTTLTAGVYDSSGTGGAFQITGTLVLDAQGDPDAVFIFKTASTLITASHSSIVLINEARPCRVFWQVGSSATLGTYSHFVGHIFALTSIGAKTGATVVGQLLARNGAVTLHANTITNVICSSSETTSAIYVSKMASPNKLTSGPGWVTYTYVVTNAGALPLSGVSVADDKLDPVTYVSGDTNGDGLLDPGEAWIYTARTELYATTTNVATATASAAEATAAITVPVSTVSGAVLPKTATPWYNLLLVGAVLALVGAAGLWMTTRRTHA